MAEMEDDFMIKEKSLELKSKDLSNLIYFDAEKIDKGMWEILYELNKKGWRTTFCCEGHVKDNYRWNAYISFDKNTIPNMDNLMLYPPKVQKGWKGVKPFSYKSSDGASVYWFGTWSKKWTKEMQEEERLNMLKEVLKWAKELPYKN